LSAFLQSVRVIDLSRVLAGPFGGQIMAEMGADVIKVEPPGGDPSRAVGPHTGGRSIYYSSLNTGKRGVALDLATPDGQAALSALIASADVVLHNYLPASATALGLAPATLLDRHPDLVVVTIAGFARGSSLEEEPAFDLTIQAESGVMSVTGEPGRPPVRAGVALSDLIAGIWAAFAAVGALFARDRGAGGTHVEIPMVDATLPLLSYMASTAMHTGRDPEPVASGHHSLCPYGAFPTSDGWVVIAVLADKFWPRLGQAFDLGELAADETLAGTAARKERAGEIDAAIAAILEKMTTAEAEDRLRAAGVPNAPVRSLLDALGTPYVQARNLVADVATPEGHYAVVRSPLDQTDGAPRPAPALGQHTIEVLTDVLGADSPVLRRLTSSAGG
jgi:crotonobetainyl-CoA:carnitine CoA-transferase CaiB-like acyl-CoA transferase